MICDDAIESDIKFFPDELLLFIIASWHEGAFHVTGNVYLGEFNLFQITWVELPVLLGMLLDSKDGFVHVQKSRWPQLRTCRVDCEPYICMAGTLCDEHIFDLEIFDCILNLVLKCKLHSRGPVLADLA